MGLAVVILRMDLTAEFPMLQNVAKLNQGFNLGAIGEAKILQTHIGKGTVTGHSLLDNGVFICRATKNAMEYHRFNSKSNSEC